MEKNLKEIADILGIKNLPEVFENRIITTLLTDSRSLLSPQGTLFFAIPTKTNAGERYMRSLYDRGVRNFITPTLPENMRNLPDAAILIYPNPVEALQLIAERNGNSGGEVVAITGSTGKTTLKEWIFQILESSENIVRSPRSYNSQIGVPLSMWEISEGTTLTLIEAGISRKGEMQKLAHCIKPDCVIFTDLNDEHADGFSSFEEKVVEKVSLAVGDSVKTIIYCSDNPVLSAEITKISSGKNLFDWSMESPDAKLYIEEIIFNNGAEKAAEKETGQYTENSIGNSSENAATIIRYRFNGVSRSLPIPFKSKADIRNVCHALAFILASGKDIAGFVPKFLRLHHIDTRLSVSDGMLGCNIIYDSYTSDYSSLLPALDFMMRRKMPEQQPMLILSDLQHEGALGNEVYGKIANLLSLYGITRFIGVGSSLASHSAEFGENALFFNTTAELNDYLRNNPPHDSIILLKGTAEYNFQSVKETLEARTHETLLEVNLDAMIRNYNYFKSHLPASSGMVAMVKASGYGAGSYEIAKSLQDAGAAYLAVAVLDEGIDLRNRGITMPIMVMNPRVLDYREMFAHNLEPEIYTRRMLDEVIQQARQYNVKNFPIHIKLDTGMHRMGFIEEELPELMQTIAAQDNVRISSAFSHLATADEPSMNDYTEYQLENFDRYSNFMLAHCAYPFKRHVLNSAGILRYADKYHYDMARLGIGLYGVNTLPADIEKPLEVVSTLKSVIINLREWPEGTTIGYGRRGVLKQPSKVATIPIGYADGMNRKFGNGAIKMLVNGKEAPTIGNICMDACMIDVTGIDCAEGDTVEIFGEHLGVQRLADALNTIPYEILTSVSPRVKRIYYRE